MGKRGPKPVAVKRLKLEASNWTQFLFALRDGQPGLIQKIERKTPWFNSEFEGKEALVQISPIIVAKIIPARNASKKFPPVVKTKDWLFSPPVLPDSESWHRLKRARSVGELQLVARDIRRWVRRYPQGARWDHEFPRKALLEFPRALETHAKGLLKAKRMPNYPKTDRPHSDNKRIKFLAKVLAGLSLGIAPATATKRLGNRVRPDQKHFEEQLYLSSVITFRKSSEGKSKRRRASKKRGTSLIDPSVGATGPNPRILDLLNFYDLSEEEGNK